MPNYDFKTLSPIDFEILIRDLLQEEFKIILESFKSGRDRGIDLRFSANKENHLIVQCKHYAESGYKELFKNLKKELEKVKKLNPKRYVLATSVGLTPEQKNNIISLFSSYITKTSDIYGRDDINGLLSKFRDVEKHNFKLWLTNIVILEEIFNRKSKNISRDELGKIHLHSKYYVQNESFKEAIDILEKYNFCIIAGIPGIGKTILAEMLSLYYAKNGYEIVKIASDISEAHEFDYINQRRVFYYDDFLGQTSLSEKLNKNEDQKILDFISTITGSKVSKLILTTREYILNQARLVYEKISRANITPNMCIVDLSKYTRLNRAKILYNHIYFSDLPESYKLEILNSKKYLEIIDHYNYSPRIIDFMTQSSRVQHIMPDHYINYFKENLNNPLSLWKHAFEEQISQEARNFLMVMISLPEKIFLEDLQEAFNAYHFYFSEKFLCGARPNDFKRAHKELEGNFIITKNDNGKFVVSFQNPSIRDFLREHLSSGQLELKALVQTAVFFEQILLLWNFKHDQSGEYKYRPNMIRCIDDLVTALKKTIYFKSCRLILTRYSTEINHRLAVWDIPLEERVVLVASVYGNIQEPVIRTFLEQLIIRVEETIEKKRARRENVLRLLKEFKKMKIDKLFLSSNFLKKIKSFFVNDLNWLDDVEYFFGYEDLYPEYIFEKDREKVEKQFLDLADSDFPDDPDICREEADKIKNIAQNFGLDLDSKIEALEDHAKELEEEASAEVDDNEDDHRGGNKNYCSDAEIISIFESIEIKKT